MKDSDMMNYVNVAIEIKQNYEYKLKEVTKLEDTFIIQSYNLVNNDLSSNLVNIQDVCKSIKSRNINNLTKSIQDMYELIKDSDY